MILAYHRVTDSRTEALSVHPNDLRDQIADLMDRGYTPARLSEVIKARSRGGSGRLFAVTFDDGYSDTLDRAGPVLAGFDIRSTVFVITSFPERKGPNFLDWDGVRELVRLGHEIGSHSVSHTVLSSCSQDQLRREIEESRESIAQEIGIAPVTFCYPAGVAPAGAAAFLHQAGYDAAVLTPSRFMVSQDRFRIPRIGIYGHTSQRAFRLKTSRLVRPAYERGLAAAVKAPMRSLSRGNG